MVEMIIKRYLLISSIISIISNIFPMLMKNTLLSTFDRYLNIFIEQENYIFTILWTNFHLKNMFNSIIFAMYKSIRYGGWLILVK